MSIKVKRARKIKLTAKCATAASATVIEKLVTDLLPVNVSTYLVDMSLEENLSPLTAHSVLLVPNPKSISPKNNNEIDADDDDDNHSVGTFNTLTLRIDKIDWILKYHSGDKGDSGTSDVDGDRFDVVQDFEIPMNDNEDEKLLNY